MLVSKIVRPLAVATAALMTGLSGVRTAERGKGGGMGGQRYALRSAERGALRGGTILAALAGATVSAHADLVISSAATHHVICTAEGAPGGRGTGSGTCTATAANAVLNVSTLQSLLASYNVTVTTGTVANDIDVQAAITWAGAKTLKLDAHQSIEIDELVSVAGRGGLTLVTNNDGGTGGTYSFISPGRVTFQHLTSVLKINGVLYTLVSSIQALASAVAADPSGHYALADDYDATGDGTYTSAPIATPLQGAFEGLGNVINNLTVVSTATGANVGLFAVIAPEGCQGCGTVTNFGLAASVTGGPDSNVGLLAGTLGGGGLIFQSYSQGEVVAGDGASAGGLVGAQGHLCDSSILASWSTANVEGGSASDVGGLVGFSLGTITNSYATGQARAGTAVAGTGPDSTVGGLVGLSECTISRSFATGVATGGGGGSFTGGFVGENEGVIVDSYSTGEANDNVFQGGSTGYLGGFVGFAAAQILTSYSTGVVEFQASDICGAFIGYDNARNMSSTYWDETTSTITDGSDGAGNIPNDPGIAGLTDTQLLSGLPTGFSNETWAENPSINGGHPYLIANPPP
jgi:hypothetical protein